jgi:prepilin-type N-terminal cleavage/methylation domain-containing protein
MRSGSIGTPDASRSSRSSRAEGRAGFTLLEALVALAVIVGFVGTLGPYLFHARRIMDNAEHRVAAQILVRTLVDAPFDRSQMADMARSGEVKGLRWRIVSEPMAIDVASSTTGRKWQAYRVTASVAAGHGQSIVAETIRLGAPAR